MRGIDFLAGSNGLYFFLSTGITGIILRIFFFRSSRGSRDQVNIDFRRYGSDPVRLLFSWRMRPDFARETVTSCGGILIRLPFIYCVGFWGSVSHFSLFSRNVYFKIESRTGARAYLPSEINKYHVGIFSL